jgi:hypothetical protein
VRIVIQQTETVTVTETNQPTFFEVLEHLWREKFTGVAHVHFGQGSPNVVEIPGTPQRIKLDKR